MNLTTALDTLSASLQSSLGSDWDVNTTQIDFPKDKLVDILYETFNLGYVDMTTRAYRGNLNIYLYVSYGSSYSDLLSALDNTLSWLSTFSNPSIIIGGNTETIANVGVIDGTFDDITRFRVVQLTVPFEVTL